MKSIVIFTLLFGISIGCMAQESKFKSTDTTSKLPKGSYISKGKVKIKNGYTIRPSKNGKVMLLIAPGGGNNISGAFSCNCSSGNIGICALLIAGQVLGCTGNCTCKLTISTDDVYDTAFNPEEEPSPAKGWKIFVLPMKN